MVYDFGGGTFDVSILDIIRGKINVLAVGGDNHLGGDDIDTNVLNYCLAEFKKQTGLVLEGAEKVSALCRLRDACEENKKWLSSVETTTISRKDFYQKHDLNVVLTRDQFEELNKKLFQDTIDLVQKTLEDNKISSTDIMTSFWSAVPLVFPKFRNCCLNSLAAVRSTIP
jgi:molecular chaperone DnaK (HSP70)